VCVCVCVFARACVHACACACVCVVVGRDLLTRLFRPKDWVRRTRGGGGAGRPEDTRTRTSEDVLKVRMTCGRRHCCGHPVTDSVITDVVITDLVARASETVGRDLGCGPHRACPLIVFACGASNMHQQLIEERH
jgi:hypothetical protein